MLNRASLPEDDRDLIQLLAERARLLPLNRPRRYPQAFFNPEPILIHRLARSLRRALPRLRMIWNQQRSESAGEREWDGFWQPSFLDIERWWDTEDGYMVGRERLIQFLTGLRDRAEGQPRESTTERSEPESEPEDPTEATDPDSVPEPADVIPAQPRPASVAPKSSWAQQLGGSIAVRLNDDTKVIPPGRQADIFRIVATAGGRSVPWRDVMTALHASDAIPDEDGHPVQVRHPLTSLKTLERNGRRVRDRLRPYRDLWEQDGIGARWAGGPAEAP